MIEAVLLKLRDNDPSLVVEDLEFLKWGTVGQNPVETPEVPSDKLWLVRAAGVFGEEPGPTEYMIELVRYVFSQGACCWRIPLEKMRPVSGTPYVALTRPLVMRPKEKLAARVLNLASGNKVGLALVYYQVPLTAIPAQVPSP